jgi:potassium-transporting ATPase potassium-binding subunit
MFEGWVQIAIYVSVLIALTPPLGAYMARVYTPGETVLLERVLGRFERLLYRILRVDVTEGQDWKHYGRSLLVFSLVGWLVMYAILRTQTLHPFSTYPGVQFHSGTWDVTFNTVSSFVSNTNWQYYGGETTLTYFSQMMGMTVQNFVSAAAGIVVLIALIRGIMSRSGKRIGNFWQDMVRTLLYVLLPLSVIGGLLLVSQGVIQNFNHYTTVHTVVGGTQTLAQGPVASQVVIKQLGTNGGGFFNTNSAFPFENAGRFSNFIEMLFIVLIPAALTYTYGKMVGSLRQGWAIFAAMFILWMGGVAIAYTSEQHGTPAQHLAGVSTRAMPGSTGGNMEGKEVRNGIVNSALWATTTSDTSNGSVNAAMESFTGLGSAVPMSNLAMSDVVWGGVGCGLYGMLVYVLLAVFIGGLMVGRTPEYLGKKIEAREIKLVSLAALLTPLTILMTAGVAIASPLGRASIASTAPGPQGFSETLYAYMSQANNNGSAFAGYTGYIQPNPGNLGAHGVKMADIMGGLTMLFARFIPLLLVLAIAGALAGKRVAPAGPGTMRTDTPTFVILLIGVVILVGALTFFPALLLGPIAQALTAHVF